MTSEVVHHVALRPEALPAVLWALERPVVVVHAHVHGKVVPVVERLATGGHWADKICPKLVIGQVGLQVAN